MESLSIPDEVYDRTHSFVGKDGEILLPPGPSTIERDASDADSDDEQAFGETIRRHRSRLKSLKSHGSKSLKSIYLAEGIHHQIELDDLEVLPDRFQSGNTKARITWFGALCMAGIGMFVEAYIIITTVSHFVLILCYIIV